ncbi:hypothetical protein [Marinobacter sp. F4216]|uniref:hypothetical protein n=1 Tax=Marinobacter sp. F4216 TaxID=2874281 RepID=UPI001CBBBDD6|nr:hypothetical protein [Marinobacter sp. F4216]MBZ2168107.1 hypothetical protein [Marinobacter sp. F4216]
MATTSRRRPGPPLAALRLVEITISMSVAMAVGVTLGLAALVILVWMPTDDQALAPFVSTVMAVVIALAVSQLVDVGTFALQERWDTATAHEVMVHVERLRIPASRDPESPGI